MSVWSSLHLMPNFHYLGRLIVPKAGILYSKDPQRSLLDTTLKDSLPWHFTLLRLHAATQIRGAHAHPPPQKRLSVGPSFGQSLSLFVVEVAVALSVFVRARVYVCVCV